MRRIARAESLLRIGLVALLGLAACRFPDEAGGPYQCDSNGTCPAGSSCVDDLCVSEGEACAAAVAVTAGDSHTCALRGDGTASCWGRNRSGELGDGTTDDHTRPVPVMGPTRFAAITAGADHTCALAQDASAWCWGSNASGQRGAMVDGSGPAQVAGLGRVTAIAAGNAHSCALLDDHTMWCWGANSAGQLGTGDTSPTRRPAALAIGGVRVSDVQEIAVRGDTTCAIRGDGALSCWGDNSGGQLGDGTTQSRSLPVPIALPDPIAHVALGDQSVCALTRSGAVYCLGPPYATLAPPGKPLHIELPGAAASIISGGRFACATAAGEGDARSVWCWGADDSEQLADGASDTHLVPLVSAHKGVLAGGRAHLCSVSSSSSLSCSGDNAFGQLGNGHRTTQGKPPAPIAGLEGITSIAAGDGHTCAVAAGAGAVCWGRNDFGQVGDGSNDDRSQPTRVEDVDHALEIVTGGDHSCALLEDHTARCWGANGRGQIGAGTRTARELPRAVIAAGMPLANIKQIVAGDAHTCALLADQTVRCWGWNGNNQLGNGSGDSSVPLQVVGPMGAGNLSGVVEIAAGERHTCALLDTQRVMCWGYNAEGELGDGSLANSAEPVVVVGLAGIAHIRARGLFSCALDTQGTVTCWGAASEGQLGNGELLPVKTPGAPVEEVVGATQVMAGGSHACALSNAGLKCWGASDAGQVGTGDYSRVLVPAAVQLAGVTNLAGGTDHTCAVVDGGRVTCWGNDRSGQLGDGSFDTHAPVAAELPCP